MTVNNYILSTNDPETGEVLYVEQTYWNNGDTVAALTADKTKAYKWNHGKVVHVVAVELEWHFKRKLKFEVLTERAGPEDRP